MKRITIFLLFIAAAWTTNQATAQDSNDKYQWFKDLKKMQGDWFSPTKRGDILESWSLENDSTMVGNDFKVRIEDGDTAVLGSLRLELRNNEIIYSGVNKYRNKGQRAEYKLESYVNNIFTFVNPNVDYPQKIMYEIYDKRSIRIAHEGVKAGKLKSEEVIYEREFTAEGWDTYARIGINAMQLAQSGQMLPPSQQVPAPTFGPALGWDLGFAVNFIGRGGFFKLNAEAGLSGRGSQITTNFFSYPDTTDLIRDGRYRSVWFYAAIYPEIRLLKNQRLYLHVGPYYARQVANTFVGTAKPDTESNYRKVDDLANNDLGFIFGLTYKWNIFKKDIDGKIGLRATYGLQNIDNLFTEKGCNGSILCNGNLQQQGISLSYMFNFMKL